ncbi:MAG: GNAT family N-acetyltransferase [Candidatus Obscuribacterales bacterium]|nr:GNAT family N-acetyltransferase [Candidatus Obscuribacterales bacterium]
MSSSSNPALGQLQRSLEPSASELGLLNVLEPEYLIDAFMTYPPLDFKSIFVSVDTARAPAFKAIFDLLTTLDQDAEQIRSFFKNFAFFKRFVSFPTLFVGTTATEYSNYPDLSDYKGLISALLKECKVQDAQLLIVKDVPEKSPLLTERENQKAEQLLKQCQEQGFLLLEGQALAYVPIDFSSVDQYMMRLSKSRRKEFRKKLKESSRVVVEELSCGARAFLDDNFLDLMYRMYENVYQQSEIHFDILSREFFAAVLQDASGNGKVFCYRVDGKLIGYNICFVRGDRLVDKYVGFVYPQAREANLYFISWFYNLEYAVRNKLKYYIAGWTDPAVKASLGASFTMTRHAVFIRNPILRAILTPFKHLFESDSAILEKSST